MAAEHNLKNDPVTSSEKVHLGDKQKKDETASCKRTELPNTAESQSDGKSRPIKREISLCCIDCRATSCPMWRRTKENDIICNVCHLRRVKASRVLANTVKQKEKSKESARSSSKKSRISARIKFTNGKYGEKITKNGHNRNRRAQQKKKPLKAPEGTATIVTSKSIHYKGLLYQVGDIVSVSDINGGTFYAQLRGFLQNEYLEKSAVVSWLIPLVLHPTRFDPVHFTPGPDEDTPRPMECFEFVCRAPTDLFKSRITHPPYSRTKPDLLSLLSTAAEDILKVEDTTTADVKTIKVEDSMEQ